MCKACAEKEKKRIQKNRNALKDMKMCPRCGKNKLWGDEKMCIDCRERIYEYNKFHRSSMNKNYNKIRKEAGICIKCGKRPAVSGKTKCAICAEKERIRAREYRMRKGIDVDRSERPAHGKCYLCGNPVKSGCKVCEKCYQIISENLQKERDARGIA